MTAPAKPPWPPHQLPPPTTTKQGGLTVTKLANKNHPRNIAAARKELDEADRRLQAIWAEYDKGDNRFMPPTGPDTPKLDAAFDEAFQHRSRLFFELERLQGAPRQAKLGI